VRNGEGVEIELIRSPGSAAGSEAEIDRLQGMIQSSVVRGDVAGAQAAAIRLAGFAGIESVDAIAVAIRPRGTSDDRPDQGRISGR